ncbi:resuscitation-promoting factor RpfA-like [Schistocerca nitens]|uniref:resuscitation-promoting factor RpfA-like n=1 Tax=Schistocerca nitens TaxID=7011 RepID=UPI002117B802|nr:resuscitation-promoting factor RpfA-like [Schistocerca nitens]
MILGKLPAKAAVIAWLPLGYAVTAGAALDTSSRLPPTTADNDCSWLDGRSSLLAVVGWRQRGVAAAAESGSGGGGDADVDASCGRPLSWLPRPGYLVRGGFQPRLPTSLPPPGQQQQPSPLPRRRPVPLMPPAQLHTGAPRVVAPAPAVPLQSPPPSELMDVDPSAGPPSPAVAVQPVLPPLSLGTPKESDTAAPCPAPTQQPSTQRHETLPLFVGPDAPSRPVPEAAPVVTGVHPDLGFQKLQEL